MTRKDLAELMELIERISKAVASFLMPLFVILQVVTIMCIYLAFLNIKYINNIMFSVNMIACVYKYLTNLEGIKSTQHSFKKY